MIEVKNLTKRYGDKRGITNLNFTVAKGEILGFLGPNGAGKTTTMNILTGYRPPTEGQIFIDGCNLLEQPLMAQKKIGYLPETPPLYPDLQVYSYLKFVADLKAVPRQKQRDHLQEIMELVKIVEVRDRLIKNLSKGYRQRVGLAQALISNPDILILDEPTVGLDPKQIMEIRSLIKRLGTEHTIILSSHILAEISAICGRVIIIHKGEIAAIDTPQNLARKMMAAERFFVRIHGPRDEALHLIQEIQGVIRVESIENQENKAAGLFDYLVENEKAADVKTPLFFALAARGFVIHEMRALDINLEEIFLQLTTEDITGEVS
ncbi:MAG TPA: ABC transporter ATP-binding protein [Bacillota bacterium]|nr:ABC transporter ATP-binding protein [Bacillota bacterium]